MQAKVQTSLSYDDSLRTKIARACLRDVSMSRLEESNLMPYSDQRPCQLIGCKSLWFAIMELTGFSTTYQNRTIY